MQFMKLEDGDSFESNKAEWIRTHLPTYEQIWSDYIGHDGRGKPLQFVGLAEERNSRRIRFAQAHYSFAVTAYQFWKACQRIESSDERIETIDAVLDHSDRLLALMALAGHVRDMFLAMDTALKMNGTGSNDLQEFYVQRSNVLHGPRLPMVVEDGVFLKIPVIASEDRRPNEWDSKAQWEQVDPTRMIYLVDFCRELREELFARICEIHPRIYAAAQREFGSPNLVPGTYDLGVSESLNTSTRPLSTVIALHHGPTTEPPLTFQSFTTRSTSNDLTNW